MRGFDRRLGLLGATALAVLVISIPVLAASPSPAASPSTSAPDKSPKPDKAAKPNKPDKGPEVAISVTGTLRASTDAKGRPIYTIATGGKTWVLSAGPAWFWGDKNPLDAYVGRSITVAGTTHAGDDEVDAETIDGKALRDPGRPPWAGGPWVVGKTHPGWKDWMADGKPGNGNGRDTAPGQLKKQPSTP